MPIKAVRSVVVIVGHTLVALIGTAIVSNLFWRFFQASSVGGVIRKEYFLSLVCSAALGALNYRTWHSRWGCWVWIVPTAWFCLGVVSLLPAGKVWYELSGAGCADNASPLACRYFFLFTIPFVRSIAYSVGTLVGSRVWRVEGRSGAEVKAVPS